MFIGEKKKIISIFNKIDVKDDETTKQPFQYKYRLVKQIILKKLK